MVKHKAAIIGKGDTVISAGKPTDAGMVILISSSKKTHKPGSDVDDVEFIKSYAGTVAELWFPDIKAMDVFIDAIEKFRNKWAEEKNG